MQADLKSTKRQLSCQSFFALLGSAHTKAAHRTLVKLTPNGRHLPSFHSFIFLAEKKKKREWNLMFVGCHFPLLLSMSFFEVGTQRYVNHIEADITLENYLKSPLVRKIFILVMKQIMVN